MGAQAPGLVADRQLLDAYLAGEPAAMTQLIQRHGGLVLSLCRRVLHNECDAEDAFQATFLVLAQKARTIRSESLTSWIYGTARRIALRARRDAARRRQHEQQARPGQMSDPAGVLNWQEVQLALDEEVERLPEIYRSVFILCSLEGASLAQASQRLGVRPGTVSSRLTGARQRLREGLARRGIDLTAALGVLTVGGLFQGGVSARLVDLTTQVGVAARAGVLTGLSTNVLNLSRGEYSLMLWKLTSGMLMLLALGTFAVTCFTGRAQTRVASTETASPRIEQAGKEVAPQIITGKVVDADSKPVANALVRLHRRDKKAAWSVTTDAEGNYRLRLPPGERSGTLVATAEGTTADWAAVPVKDAEVLLKLEREVPIEGRVLDLEGNPVHGAVVRISGIGKPINGLARWIAGMKHGRWHERLWLPREAYPVAPQVTTDRNGRFRLVGIGRDRILELRIEGKDIESVERRVVTRTEALPDGLKSGERGLHNARVDILVGPSKPIVGMVRDKKTKKPLPGILVGSVRSTRSQTTTDKNGRYRLEGVGKRADGYYVVAEGSGYFTWTKLNVPDTPGLAPLVVDFELERGIEVRGKLVNAAGKPVRGSIYYRPFTDNPHLKEYASIGLLTIHLTRVGDVGSDGSFSALAIPGKGALTVMAADRDVFDRNIPDGLKLGGLILDSFHTIVVIDVPERQEEVKPVTITLTRARKINARVVDPDGKPVPGCRMGGLTEVWDVFAEMIPEPQPEANFQIGNVVRGKKRDLVFLHDQRKLARVYRLQGDETEPLTIRLEPLGSLRGRLIRPDGQPDADRIVQVRFEPTSPLGANLTASVRNSYQGWHKLLTAKAKSDEKGHFRVEGLVPGIPYYLVVMNKDEKDRVDHHVPAFKVESGKTIDLGDVKLTKK
jgi:RNA polymerase sigma factor (sigma-70 family)